MNDRELLIAILKNQEQTSAQINSILDEFTNIHKIKNKIIREDYFF